jgi:hypothetical protein
MSDPLRADGSRSPDAEPAADKDAKIEELLLVGLDHYFAAEYEQAINVWTRALFLDRSHARARAYIERARSALAERQRECEELLQNGVAAFDRGEGDEARRLLQAAIDRGGSVDEARAVLERLDRLHRPKLRRPAGVAAESRHREPKSDRRPVGSILWAVTGVLLVGVVSIAYVNRLDWPSWFGLDDAPAATSVPTAQHVALPLPQHGETALDRARALAGAGHLHDALRELETVRSTDAQKPEADRLRADYQRQLLGLADLHGASGRDRRDGRQP